MNKPRTWVALAAFLAITIMAASWFLLIAPKRSEAAEFRDQTTQQEATNTQIKAQTAQLKQQFLTLNERQAALAKVQQQMPDNPALPSLVRKLSDFATKTGVTLKTITPSAPTAVTDSATAGAATGATGSAATASGVDLRQIGVSLNLVGTYAQLTLFVTDLQKQQGSDRAFLIDNLTLTPGSDGDTKEVAAATGVSPTLQMALTGKVFMLKIPTAATTVIDPNAAVTTTAPAGQAS
jgi:Tfp pilus assembly protein PilO